MIREPLAEAALRDPAIELIDAGPLPRVKARAAPDVEVMLVVTPNPHDRVLACALFESSGAQRVALLTPAGRELVIYDLASSPMSAVDLPATELLDVICRGVQHA